MSYSQYGSYGGPLFWTIDGSEEEISEIDANITATVKLYNRYGGFTCDLYYVFTYGDADNVSRIIYMVGEGTAETAAEPETQPADTAESETQPANTEEPATEKPAEKVTAAATASKVMVDGKQVSFEAYNINGNNFFKLRDIAMAVNGTSKNFEVGWDSANNAISLTPVKAYTAVGGELAISVNPTAKQASLSTSKVYLDGQEVQLTAYTIGGNNYFKLRDIGQALDIAITWDSATNTIGIDTAAEAESN